MNPIITTTEQALHYCQALFEEKERLRRVVANQREYILLLESPSMSDLRNSIGAFNPAVADALNLGKRVETNSERIEAVNQIIVLGGHREFHLLARRRLIASMRALEYIIRRENDAIDVCMEILKTTPPEWKRAK